MNCLFHCRQFGCWILLGLVLVSSSRADDGFTCSTNADGTLTLTGHSRPEGSLSIPASIEGHPVSAVGTEAFAYATRLTEIILPDSVVRLDPQSFAYCSTLSNVVFGAGLARVDEWAFHGCTRLAAIHVPPSNPAFSSSDGVLFNHAQTRLLLFPARKSGSYEIPPSVTDIADEAFARSTALTNVLIPSGVTRIGGWAFDRSGLTQVTLPDSITSLGAGAFSGCANLQFATLGTGLHRIEPRTFERSGLLAIDLPPSVVDIADWAFFNCPHLVRVSFSPATHHIGNRAFQACTALTRIVLPASVRILGEEAFSDCTALTEVVCEGNPPAAGPGLFAGSDRVVVTCPPGIPGWNGQFGGRPAIPSPSPIPRP